MTSRRIYGSNISLRIDGADYWADAGSILLTHDIEQQRKFDGTYRFYDPRWRFEIMAVQSLEPGSFWRMVWENSGHVVPYRFAPAGNQVASEDQPHFVGDLQIGARPDLGGEASITGSHAFEVSLFAIGEPLMVTD